MSAELHEPSSPGETNHPAEGEEIIATLAPEPKQILPTTLTVEETTGHSARIGKTTSTSPSLDPSTMHSEVPGGDTVDLSRSPSVNHENDVSSSEVSDSRQTSSAGRSSPTLPQANYSSGSESASLESGLPGTAAPDEAHAMADSAVPGIIEPHSNQSSPVLPPHPSPIPKHSIAEEEERDELAEDEDLEDDGDEDIPVAPPIAPVTQPPSRIAGPAPPPATEIWLTDHDVQATVQGLSASQSPSHEVLDLARPPVSFTSSPPPTTAPVSAITQRPGSPFVYMEPRARSEKTDASGTSGPKGRNPPWLEHLQSQGKNARDLSAFTSRISPRESTKILGPAKPKMTQPRRKREKDSTLIDMADDTDTDHQEDSDDNRDTRRKSVRLSSPHKMPSSPGAFRHSGQSEPRSERHPSAVYPTSPELTTSRRKTVDISGHYKVYLESPEHSTAWSPNRDRDKASSSTPVRRGHTPTSKISRHATSIPAPRINPSSSKYVPDRGETPSQPMLHAIFTAKRDIGASAPAGRDKRKTSDVKYDKDPSVSLKKSRTDDPRRASTSEWGTHSGHAIDVISDDDGSDN